MFGLTTAGVARLAAGKACNRVNSCEHRPMTDAIARTEATVLRSDCLYAFRSMRNEDEEDNGCTERSTNHLCTYVPTGFEPRLRL